PDVALMLETMAAVGLPPIETLAPQAARDLLTAIDATRPPGPEVAEMIDGTLPGADAQPVAWRLYRPADDDPHPLVVWFHGGGWVLGGVVSDEPFCRDLCVRSAMAVVSVDYRHAPEARFPAAVDDALAAVEWWADHAADYGCRPDALVVAGWSAGG